ncbi:MAG TPA: DISARM system SNF2-like helicase DrmD [Rhizomicrobium sp.]|nr:DISARM system SNF2-like helicase DrmD [Rhizomicrobium sp.]
MAPSSDSPETGSLIRVRSREWLVEGHSIDGTDLKFVDLACIADDAQGEELRLLLDSEIDVVRVEEDLWKQIAREGSDDPDVLAAHLRAVTWRSATAADRELFQAPFRAGIRLEPYQLLPLSKALKLPRVNLLIADDVGLGKTVEAGLVLREMLLRRRVDFVVVSAPAAMTGQWQDELAQKFGLNFTIIDREFLAAIRRSQGFSANPWRTGSRFIVSHSLLGDETYAGDLKVALGEFRPRALLILDEAHHAAPASGTAYATDSQFTRAVRGLAARFEHRLFLSATPHNGHSNSFSSLLELLDPQRFMRGVPVTPEALNAVMVRRLKSDLLKLNVSSFPKREIEPVVLDNLQTDTPELVLSSLLQDYRTWSEHGLEGTPLGQARFLFSGLQQRLFSSIPAFARTLRRHLSTLKRHRDGVVSVNAGSDAAALLAKGAAEADVSAHGDEEEQLALLQSQDDELADGATSAVAGALRSFDEAIAIVEKMLEISTRYERRSDARVNWLINWIKQNLLDKSGHWNQRRLLIFTEWEDTRLWLEKRLKEEISGSDQADERIAIFTGITGQHRRDDVKSAFNADPKKEPLRILICTDAAREGINLQTRCHDLIHFDLPWNPSRLEQRNGRIDRKLQPSPTVTCRYFIYAQREEDKVLDALVRKTETIREQLGSAGEVLLESIHHRLASGGISRASATALADSIGKEDGTVRARNAKKEMDDDEDRRLARIDRELQHLKREMDDSRRQVGIDPADLRAVLRTALDRDHVPLVPAPELEIAGGFRLDPTLPAFTKDPSWAQLFDELREGRPPGRKKLAEWRAEHPVRAITFEPPILADGRDADGVVQVHLEHRLVRRLLARFVSQGFQSGLNRATAIVTSGGQPRVVLIGRLALYGPGAARLHEEIIPITAGWTDAATRTLRIYGRAGEETTLAELNEALKAAVMPAPDVVKRLLSSAQRDISELRPILEQRAATASSKANTDLADIAKKEAASLEALLRAQREQIRKEQDQPDQLELDLTEPAERRQREADRRRWAQRLTDIGAELRTEPARVAASYEVRASRLEPVGIVYLWPKS